MTPTEIAVILKAHAAWWRGEAVGSRADLRDADLRGADLRGADLGGANLGRADLRGADLRGADLRGADLGGANLGGANLGGADLGRADLRGADLRGADLGGADLGGANLGRADLRGADLRGADLGDANLMGADLGDLVAHRTIVPETGAFEAWKSLADNSLCRVRIPAEAARVGGLVGRKCRAEWVEVLEGAGESRHDASVVYSVGAVVKPDKWDPDPRVECSHGIHFFMTKTEALEYR